MRQPAEKAVVTYDHWLENEEDHLLDVYDAIQGLNRMSGRSAFDAPTCTFPTFCRLAYDHSFKYLRRDSALYGPIYGPPSGAAAENVFAHANADAYAQE